jgi:hypothetical protein
MPDSTSYLFDPTPYSTPAGGRRRRRSDPAVAAALARLGAALAEIPPKEQARRHARAVALDVRGVRR